MRSCGAWCPAEPGARPPIGRALRKFAELAAFGNAIAAGLAVLVMQGIGIGTSAHGAAKAVRAKSHVALLAIWTACTVATWVLSRCDTALWMV